MSAAGFRESVETLDGVEVRVTSYEVGRRFSCRVDNRDQSGNIARGMGDTREAAEAAAREQAHLALQLRSSGRAMRDVANSLGRKEK